MDLCALWVSNFQIYFCAVFIKFCGLMICGCLGSYLVFFFLGLICDVFWARFWYKGQDFGGNEAQFYFLKPKIQLSPKIYWIFFFKPGGEGGLWLLCGFVPVRRHRDLSLSLSLSLKICFFISFLN